jgi:hypothetical protein
MLDVHVWLSTARPAITFVCPWVGCASSTSARPLPPPYPLALSSHPRPLAHPRGGTPLDALNPTLNSIGHQGERHHAPIHPVPASIAIMFLLVVGGCALGCGGRPRLQAFRGAS